jgi:hypothetical protein
MSSPPNSLLASLSSKLPSAVRLDSRVSRLSHVGVTQCRRCTPSSAPRRSRLHRCCLDVARPGHDSRDKIKKSPPKPADQRDCSKQRKAFYLYRELVTNSAHRVSGKRRDRNRGRLGSSLPAGVQTSVGVNLAAHRSPVALAQASGLTQDLFSTS